MHDFCGKADEVVAAPHWCVHQSSAFGDICRWDSGDYVHCGSPEALQRAECRFQKARLLRPATSKEEVVDIARINLSFVMLIKGTHAEIVTYEPLCFSHDDFTVSGLGVGSPVPGGKANVVASLCCTLSREIGEEFRHGRVSSFICCHIISGTNALLHTKIGISSTVSASASSRMRPDIVKSFNFVVTALKVAATSFRRIL